MTCQQPGDRRVCDAKSAGGLSDAGSVVYRRASCPQVLVGQHSKAGAGVNTGCDESLPNRLDVEPVLLRNLHLSQTGRVIGHERRVRRYFEPSWRGEPWRQKPWQAFALWRFEKVRRAPSIDEVDACRFDAAHPSTQPASRRTDRVPSSLRSNAGTQD